jgi:phospholipid transport system substrate-binding protein
MFSARSQIGSMNKRSISKTLVLVICLCLWGSHAIAAENPQAVVQTATDQVLKIVKQYPQDTRARREQIQAVVDGYFDFEAIARLAVGPRWKSLLPEQQQEFTQEFSKLLFNKYITAYIGDIEKHANQKITYNQKSIYQGYVLVEALVSDPSGPVSLDYYLHLKDGNWKAYDIAVGGMSLVANYRSEFDPLLANGSFDRLLTILRQKIAKMCGSNRC